MMKVLKFSTPTCTYCKVTSPMVNKFAESVGYEVEEVDASVNTIKRDQYDVMSVPTIVIVDNLGEVQQKVVGAPDIMAFINK